MFCESMNNMMSSANCGTINVALNSQPVGCASAFLPSHLLRGVLGDGKVEEMMLIWTTEASLAPQLS